MNKTVVILLLSFISLWGCTSKQPPSIPEFKYHGKEDFSGEERINYLDGVFSDERLRREREDFENGLYESGKRDPVIPNVESAVYVAKMLITNKYGLNELKKQLPLHVYLINNLTWSITGDNSRYGHLKMGEAPVKCLINRLDGRCSVYKVKQ